MKGGIYILLATISFFISLLLAVLFMLFKYRKKLKDSNYSPVEKQSINFESCVNGAKKPYIKRVVQYMLGYNEASEDTDHDDDGGGIGVNTGLTKLVPVQPSSESDGEFHGSTHSPYGRTSSLAIRPRTQSSQNQNTMPQIDVEMYRNRSYTDSPSPEGRSGIWRARESLFYKYGKNRRSSSDEVEDSRRSSLFTSEFQKRSKSPRPTPDRRSRILYDETTKVTGKPPLSPKTVKAFPSALSRQSQQQFNFNTRRNSAAMVLDKTQTISFLSGSSSVNGSVENLATELGNLEISLYYNSEERLLKVCVLNVQSPEERSLIDTYIKVAFYLFEKPYKNEMQLWSDATKSIVRRTFSYLVKNLSDLQRAVLKFTLKRKNSLGKNKVLGKSILRLCGVNLIEAQAYTLKLEYSITELLGELLVSVCHQATTGILRVGVIRAMGLAKTMRKTMGAPFLIIELRNQDEVIFVKNTKQKSNKINPLFEESFDIPVSTDSKIPLDEFHLRITVFRYTFSGSNDVVGLVCLETGSCHQNEAEHWKEVTMNPHTTIMKWHKLRIA